MQQRLYSWNLYPWQQNEKSFTAGHILIIFKKVSRVQNRNKKETTKILPHIIYSLQPLEKKETLKR